jgi:elongator complex protein 2
LPLGGRRLVPAHVIPLKPRYIPLAIAIGDFGAREVNSVFIAVGGTRNSVQAYVVSGLNSDAPSHSLQATLAGHESWIPSLTLKRSDIVGEYWLASASQDKSVRIWQIRRFQQDVSPASADDVLALEQSLTAKVHTIEADSEKLSITFEALLLGHEDWVYTAAWNHGANSLQLLTASADNSLMIWEPELSTGIWVSSTRLGEISGQKGATSATGSTGGFWIGLRSPDGATVTCLGKTGSWRIWDYDQNLLYWIQRTGLTGHTKAVTDLSWTKEGEYLLSTSSDQTTRLHAEWESDSSTSWHEFARPQIHGYDLNCVQTVSSTRFVSGADEKLLRVFNQPKNVAHMLQRLCKVSLQDDTEAMPEAANMPVLGLSNKAITSDSMNGLDGAEDGPIGDIAGTSAYDSVEPPTEDYLARHTLWPEYEKLYGHGHEISALSANNSETLIATACKASSTEHAVIRLYNTKDWHEIRPSLAAHSLTIARLQFSQDDDKLLSVGRDRQWALFKPRWTDKGSEEIRTAPRDYALSASNPKGHTRMILDVACSPVGGASFFATAGRDKTVKIWTPVDEKEGGFVCKTTISRPSPVTAIDFYDSRNEDHVCLAVGEESGKLSYHIIRVYAGGAHDATHLELVKSIEVEERMCPSKAVTRLAWRPGALQQQRGDDMSELAVASADSSLRILSVDWQDSI